MLVRSVNRRWFKSFWRVFVGLFVLWAISFGTFVTIHQSEEPSHLSISVQRIPGKHSLASRCSECVQPGDHVRVSLRGLGVERNAYGLRVYRDSRELIVACDACTSCDFLIPLIGQYDIVGVQMSPDCPLATGSGIDRYVAMMINCGARVIISQLAVP